MTTITLDCLNHAIAIKYSRDFRIGQQLSADMVVLNVSVYNHMLFLIIGCNTPAYAYWYFFEYAERSNHRLALIGVLPGTSNHDFLHLCSLQQGYHSAGWNTDLADFIRYINKYAHLKMFTEEEHRRIANMCSLGKDQQEILSWFPNALVNVAKYGMDDKGLIWTNYCNRGFNQMSIVRGGPVPHTNTVIRTMAHYIYLGMSEPKPWYYWLLYWFARS